MKQFSHLVDRLFSFLEILHTSSLLIVNTPHCLDTFVDPSIDAIESGIGSLLHVHINTGKVVAKGR